MGPIDNSNSGSNHAIVHAQNDRLCLGPIEICYSGPKGAVLDAKNTEEGNSGANHAGLHAQSNRWGLVRIETCKLVQKSLFCLKKPQIRAGTYRDKLFWC